MLLNVSQSVSSVAQSCPTPSDPMDCSMPGLVSFTNYWSLVKKHHFFSAQLSL